MDNEILRIKRILDQLPFQLQPFIKYLLQHDIEKLAQLVHGKYTPVINRYLMVYFRDISIRLGNPMSIQKIAELLDISSKSYSKIKYRLKKAGLVEGYYQNKMRLRLHIQVILNRLVHLESIDLADLNSLEILSHDMFEELDLVLSPQLKPHLAVLLALIIQSTDAPFTTFERVFDDVYYKTAMTKDDVWPFIKNAKYHYPKYFASRNQVEV